MLPKYLGGQGFQEKLLGGPWGSLYCGFYCIFINKFFENLPGGLLFYPPLLCASGANPIKIIMPMPKFWSWRNYENSLFQCYKAVS
jgi:hypothetical protein